MHRMQFGQSSKVWGCGAALAAFMFFMAPTHQVQARNAAASPSDTVRSALSHHARTWTGNLFLQYPERRSEIIPARFELKQEGENRFTGQMVLERETSEGRKELALAWVFQLLPGGIWNARIGDMGPFEPRLYQDTKGIFHVSNIMWVGPNSTFEMIFGSDQQELTMSGFLPVPAEMANGPVWADLRVKRSKTLFMVGTFEVNFWECLGILGGLLFGLRFVVQIIASERAKQSVTPESFWWISLIATVIYTIYGFYFQRIAVILAQLMAWYVYVRNLVLIRSCAKAREKNEGSNAE